MEPQRKNKEQISEEGDEDLENRVWVTVLKNDFLWKSNENARLCLWKYCVKK